MMRKILILGLLALATQAFAQSSKDEQAVILNQELQFLEDSVNNIQSISLNADSDTNRNKTLNEKSLERTYFGDQTEEDTVSTRTASPKRRSY